MLAVRRNLICNASLKRSGLNQARAMIFVCAAPLSYYVLKSVVAVSGWILMPSLVAFFVILDWVLLDFDIVSTATKNQGDDIATR